MDQAQVASVLSQMLPHVVDQLTRTQVPEASALSRMMKDWQRRRDGVAIWPAIEVKLVAIRRRTTEWLDG